MSMDLKEYLADFLSREELSALIDNRESFRVKEVNSSIAVMLFQTKPKQSGIRYCIGKLVLPWSNIQEAFYHNVSPQILRNTERCIEEDKLTGIVFDESKFHYCNEHDIYHFAKASLRTRILFLAKDFGFVETIGMGTIGTLAFITVLFAINAPLMEAIKRTLPPLSMNEMLI